MAFITKDSGKRQDYPTGARRDVAEGKGRFDLIPAYCLKRLALAYERGAEKYGDSNWQKGIPISRCVSSAVRHLYQWVAGKKDEDHLAAVVFNVFAIMFYEHFKPEMMDLSTAQGYDEEEAPKEQVVLSEGWEVPRLCKERECKHMGSIACKACATWYKSWDQYSISSCMEKGCTSCPDVNGHFQKCTGCIHHHV